MRAKTLIELLTLSTNLYIISKDEAFMENLKEMTRKGKDKLEDIIAGVGPEGDERSLFDRLKAKAKEAEEEMERKIAEFVRTAYEKMNIAHTDKVAGLQKQIEQLRAELRIAEARISQMENRS